MGREEWGHAGRALAGLGCTGVWEGCEATLRGQLSNDVREWMSQSSAMLAAGDMEPSGHVWTTTYANVPQRGVNALKEEPEL